jgi:Cytochrome P460
MKFWICGLILSWIAMPWIAMTSAGHTQELSITEQTAFSFYKALELLTPSPIVVSPELAVKCTTPSAAELAADEQRAGPHSNAFVNLYVNEIAKQAIAERVGLFPAGAVIVKEKLERDVSAAAVGGMVKRSAGFDPDHGDWEYFYATKSGGFASGRLSTCVGCHAQAKARDYVFYVRPRL